MLGPVACPHHHAGRGRPTAGPKGEIQARSNSSGRPSDRPRADQYPPGTPSGHSSALLREPCAAASGSRGSSVPGDATVTLSQHPRGYERQRAPTPPRSGRLGELDGLGFLQNACCASERRPRLSSSAGTVAATNTAAAAATATVMTPALALALLFATPLGPAAARIPTEVVLSDNGGGSSVAGPSAVFQLAAPPSAVLMPTGSGAGTTDAADPLEPGTSGAGATRGSGPVPRRTAVAPGTMVGTPNYARGPGGASGSGQRSTAREAAEALELLNAAREAVDGGQHNRALELYGRLVSEHPDLALAEYGRIGRAMMLYQVGRTSDSILALEDEEAVLRGAAEVHAALAALLYSERPNLALRAEEEWNMACLFDKRYSDPEWVRTNKHWPPRMISALQRFLSLS